MQTKIERLVNIGEFKQAIDVCKSELDSNPTNILYWQTQLGYLYFLNEKASIDDFYENAPSTFRNTVLNFPDDINSIF